MKRQEERATEYLVLAVDAPLTDGVVGETGVQGVAVSGPGDGGADGLGLQGGLGDQLGDDLLVLQIPDADAIVGGGAQPVVVGGEGQLVDGDGAVQLVQVLGAGDVPQLGLAVLAGGGTQGAIGGDGNGVDGTGVALQGLNAAELSQGPDLDVTVGTTGDDQGGGQSGGEADAVDPAVVAVLVHGEHALALDVPHLQLTVAGTGDDLAVVGGEGNGQDVLGVALELGDAVTVLQVPQTQGLIPGGGQSELGVVGQGDLLDEVGVALQAAVGDGAGLLSGVGVD